MGGDVSKESWLMIPQPRLRISGLIALIAITSIITPISMDMYTPALPSMTEVFQTNEATINLTLIVYNLFFAIGILTFGTLSDKVGRKPIWVGGAIVYTIAGLLCAIAPSIAMLIGARIIQALGAGALNSIAMAVVKDAVKPENRESLLALNQVFCVIGPVVAPVVGALIIMQFDWRATFWVLVAIGVLLLIMTLLFEETLPKEERHGIGLGQTVKNLGIVARNMSFTPLMIVFTLFSLVQSGFVAVGPYIYIDFFGLSELVYGIVFALISLVGMVGPVLLMLSKKILIPRQLFWVTWSVLILTGLFMLFIGPRSPYFVTVAMIVNVANYATYRPCLVNILLEQIDKNAGAASSLINFTMPVLSCIGMLLSTAPWPNFVLGMGVIMTCVGIIGSTGYGLILRSSIPIKGLKD